MTARPLVLLALLGPAAALGYAFFSQYVTGLHPCPMCIWQRWPHGIAIALASVALTLGAGRAGAASLVLGALALVVGSGIGAFHAGVELGYWEGPSTCVGGDLSGLSAEQVLQNLLDAPLVRCDEVVWSLLGVSMAGWNAILSLGLAGVTAAAARAYASSSASQ